MEKIAVLGSTGSIGTQTLEVLKEHADSFQISLLSANTNVPLLAKQITLFRPTYVYLADQSKHRDLMFTVSDQDFHLIATQDELHQLLQSDLIDTIVAAVSGFAGLASVWAGVMGGKKIALANKESLVTAGSLLMPLVHRMNASLIPVDSEHSAIFQCIENTKREIEKVILTGSGGPFRDTKKKDFSNITVEQALRHPNWSMGRKITIDSATLANKGLEMIEASYLFDLPYEKIEVIIHRQSIVHSLVQFVDGSVLAQMGLPDMKLPIQYALSSPYSIPNQWKRLDLTQMNSLTFENPRYDDFPALKLAYQTRKDSGCGGLCYNTGNEVGVDLFLKGKIGFTEIPWMIERAMERFMYREIESIDHIFDLDQEIRRTLYALVERNRI